MKPATTRAARGIAVAAPPWIGMYSAPSCASMSVKNFVRRQGSMTKWMPPFATSGAIATPPRVRNMMSLTLTPTIGAKSVVFSASGISWNRGLSVPIKKKGTVPSCLILFGLVAGLPVISKAKRVALWLAILLLDLVVG